LAGLPPVTVPPDVSLLSGFDGLPYRAAGLLSNRIDGDSSHCRKGNVKAASPTGPHRAAG